MRSRKLEKSIERLIDSYAEGLLEKGEFEPRLRDRKTRLAALEAEAARVRDAHAAQQQMRLVVGRIEAFARKIESGLETMEWVKRRDLIRALVKHVEIGHGAATVAFRVHPTPALETAAEQSVQHCPTRRSDATTSQPASQGVSISRHRCALAAVAAWPGVCPAFRA